MGEMTMEMIDKFEADLRGTVSMRSLGAFDLFVANARRIVLQDRIEELETEVKQLRSELNGRLGQPFGDPAKS